MPARSPFVTFEGVDGSGKSTQAGLARAVLEAAGWEVVATREPGGTRLGERIRELLLEGTGMSPWAEAALFAAARAELADEVIRPALARGCAVVCDRYIDSSLVYQGLARRLGVDRVLELNVAVADLLPARTFVLDLDPALAASRIGGDRDRIEREADGFHQAVAAGYRELAGRFPERIRLLDASLPVEVVAEQVRRELEGLMRRVR